jgi:anthranilate phosphoribosyltransferase
MESFKSLIAKVASGSILTTAEAFSAFETIFAGQATPAQIGAFVIALKLRGETVDEIIGAARAMRARMRRVDAPEGTIDIVGTGGDGRGSYNVSTLAALIVASCGIPVAKHGNRAVSSKSGSSDILAALGVKTGLEPHEVEFCLADSGIAFMNASAHHAAMSNVATVRTELGTRTIFNLLGPLTNPASVGQLLVGVFAQSWVEPMARVLRELGARRAWVVHGLDGLDEITTTGDTFVASLHNNEIFTFVVTPEDAGIARASLADLEGGDVTTNAAALRAVLDGTPTPYRDIALINAAAALVIAGNARDLAEGAAIAARAIDDGRTAAKLLGLVEASNRALTNPTNSLHAYNAREVGR